MSDIARLMNRWNRTRGTSSIVLLLFAAALVFPACSKKEEKPPSTPTTGITQVKPGWDRTSIAGVVQLPEKEQHEGILVFAAGKSLMAFTDQDGQYTFLDVPLGTYSFMARMDGYETASLGIVTVEGSPRKPAQPIRLPSTVLEQLPEDEKGVEYGDVIGKVEVVEGDTADGVLVQIMGTLFKTVTDEEGTYRFFNLSPKAYTLRFSKSGYVAQTTSVNVLPGGPTYVASIQLPSIEKQQDFRKIFGIVEMLDLKGNPTNKFGTVIIALEGTSYVALPDAQGKFVFDKIPAGNYTINATAPGFINRSKIDVDLSDLEYTNVSVVMDEVPSESASKGVIRGTVRLENMEDHSGVTVAVTGTSLVAVTDVQGRYLIAGVPEGTYNVLAQLEDFYPVTVENVEVKKSEELELEEIVLEMRMLYPEVTYTDPGDGQRGILVQQISPVFIRFNKKMKPETLKRAFSINPDVDYRIFAGRQSRFSDFDLLYVELLGNSETDPFRFDTRYTVTVSSMATDFDGLSMEEDYRFTFETGKASITGSRPGDGDSNVFLNLQNPVFVFFNAPIDSSSLETDMIEFDPEPETNVHFRVTKDPETGWSVLQIYAQLTDDTRYTLRLARGIETLSGDSISNLPWSIRFETAEKRDVNELIHK